MDSIGSNDHLTSGMNAGGHAAEAGEIIGRYTATFRDADGNVYHEEIFDNAVTTLGKNFLLDTTLGGSSYSVTGPFMGLVVGASAPTFAPTTDTMASHAGWTEGGTTNNPLYTSRLTLTFSAAASGTKATSSTNTYTFTSAGTVQGAFIVTGSGATNVNLATTGTLFSEGALTTAQPVISGNTLTLTYSTTLT